jgi:two-component system chemotaxis response regulator CheY
MAVALSNLRVLVVEDSPQAMKLLKMVLGGVGVHQVYTAPDGRAAQTFLDEAPELIDLIVCDWQMPNMTGLELLQQVRSTYPEMPFIMLTGKTDLQSVKVARQYGVDAYVAKPYSPQQLEQKLVALAATL